MKTYKYDLAARLRLGIVMFFTNIKGRFKCSRSLDEDGFHLLTCRHAREWTSQMTQCSGNKVVRISMGTQCSSNPETVMSVRVLKILYM